jgi:lysozyme
MLPGIFQPHRGWQMNQKGLDILKRFEGLRLTAYLCPAGVPTIGIGHTGPDVTAEDVRNKKKISAKYAETLLKADLAVFESVVAQACTLEPNDNQLSAMVCLAYNIGPAGFKASSVLKAHNRGDYQAAARAFGLWNKATVAGKKVVLPGLVSRRAAEAALYLEPVADEQIPQEPMPQAVEPERPMTESNIVRSGSIAAGASGLAVASEAARQVSDIKDALGQWLPYVVLVVALGAACYVVWERFNQRKRGEA